MKNILNLVITVILVIIAAKLLIWAVPVIVVIGVGIWLYSRYKMKKILKQYNKAQEQEENSGYKFSQGYTNEYKTTEDEINKQDKFNGTVIDVDFEDVKRD